VTQFQLPEVPRLSRSTVDRAEPVRTDPERLAKLWAKGRLVLVDKMGRTPVRADATALSTRPTSGDLPAEALLLGELDGVGYWALTTDEELREGTPSPDRSWGLWTGATSADGEQWHDVRTTGALLSDTDAGLFTTAVALTSWHARARFCAKCGASVERINAGWATRCTGCGREEYPRTDPAVICLVHDGADRVLIARQPVWPEGRFSVLAGFVEAGESLEACVAREIHEEVGVTVHDVQYLGSQAWPFPRSLMIGFHALADPDASLSPADGEIAEAMWVTRADLRKALADGDWGAGAGLQRLLLPGRVSIARSMLESWAALD
jgi:NAD+ diphosphatase